jgi:hypothetical protein
MADKGFPLPFASVHDVLPILAHEVPAFHQNAKRNFVGFE